MKKIVFILGAGFAMPWNGPKTNDLTSILIKDLDYKTQSGIPLGEFLCQLLTKYYSYDPETVNFEHIINLLEDLYSYYSSLESKGLSKFRESDPIIFEIKDIILQEILDFDNIYPKSNGFYSSLQNNNPFLMGQKRNFLANVYKHFIHLIIDEIKKYDEKCEDNLFNLLNTKLNKFIEFFKCKSIRFYSINYDNIPVKIISKKLFNGFNIPDGGILKSNFSKIMDSNKDNISYNLHGSIFFDYLLFEWVYNPNKVIKLNIGTSDEKDQTGKSFIKSNILTGLNKSSKILFDPQYSFYQSFYSDCSESELIISIGYSFIDHHINKAISDRLKIKSPLILNINFIQQFNDAVKNNEQISPWDEDWDKLSNNLCYSSSDTFDEEINLQNSSKKGWIFTKEKKQIFYYKGFYDFLMNEDWKKIIRKKIFNNLDFYN